LKKSPPGEAKYLRASNAAVIFGSKSQQPNIPEREPRKERSPKREPKKDDEKTNPYLYAAIGSHSHICTSLVSKNEPAEALPDADQEQEP